MVSDFFVDGIKVFWTVIFMMLDIELSPRLYQQSPFCQKWNEVKRSDDIEVLLEVELNETHRMLLHTT